MSEIELDSSTAVSDSMISEEEPTSTGVVAARPIGKNVERKDTTTDDALFPADVVTKPFNFLAPEKGLGVVSNINPFANTRRKRSGLLNVVVTAASSARLVRKRGGDFNVSNSGTSPGEGKSRLLWRDLFITILGLGWSWIMIIFSAAFFVSWLGFAVIWYLIFYFHGDFDGDQDQDFVPCASDINDFTSCFLFSVETQHTIGYGGRATTEECPAAVIAMCVQSILGVVIQSCMAGIIFAKFTTPIARGETIVFSKNALVCLRNGALHLVCQATDLRRCGLLGAYFRMIVVHRRETEEGEVIPYYRQDLTCTSELDPGNDKVFMLWPLVLGHKIDSTSPFYEMTPQSLLGANFEIVVLVEGTTAETGNTVQVRTSYLPNEILWGHRFDHTSMSYDGQVFAINHAVINTTRTDQTPRMSAKQLDLIKETGAGAST